MVHMGKSTVPLTGRVPEPLKEEVSDLSEEEQMSQSAMVRELIKDGLARREEEDGGRERGRSVADSDAHSNGIPVAHSLLEPLVLLGCNLVCNADHVVESAVEGIPVGVPHKVREVRVQSRLECLQVRLSPGRRCRRPRSVLVGLNNRQSNSIRRRRWHLLELWLVTDKTRLISTPQTSYPG